MRNYEEAFPYTVKPGDSVTSTTDRMGRPIGFKPIKNVEVNPRGCKGKTHLDGGCYDNVALAFVQRA